MAKAYKAACTPEFYVFDGQQRLAYHGQFDDARPKNPNSPPVTGRDLRNALDAVLAGKPAPQTRPSIGCNLKASFILPSCTAESGIVMLHSEAA